MTMVQARTEPVDEEGALERLGRLFDSQNRRIYHLARRLCRDHEEARDLMQETFLRAARRIQSLPDTDPAAEAWLVRTTVNLCRDLGRRRAVRVRDEHKLEPPRPIGPNPEAAAVARASVEAALACLAPRRRAVLVLSQLEELPTSEVARLLGLTQATVRWHLAKARKEVRSLLESGLKDKEQDR
jgi:RNA polymerase sigma factor (sigma-70 family)